MNKLYVGNISFQTNEEELKEAFSQHGEVLSVKIITDRDTGRSRGFGFVEMNDADQANACVENLDGYEVQGRALRVNIAQEKPKGERRSFNKKW
ncbi:RNA-binding protein [Halobacteriovorax sp. GB3]|uniref:RNA recognition motif domain-containing protein n=1 Tax=Halobacteriovorax sp. GB3 TaxID=2719615 RepID=UPI00236203DB|nr:RNA-binding protein [Halobacteriovorax sp. GB3]MDD0853506.1 RNA-binding protein [Halobacteriovorax sp. GB3]